MAEQYDPNDHTVPEVQEHLATVDDAERDRILQAERDGQARVGIVGSDEPEATTQTADAIVVQRPGTVDQAKADADAKRRNAELEEANVISGRGYIGSDASDLRG